MNVNLFLLIAFCIAILFILFLVTKLRRVRGQLSIIEEALEDIKSGNLNRRMLAKKKRYDKKNLLWYKRYCNEQPNAAY